MLSKSRVKYIQSLYHKKFRDAELVFVIEGPKIAEEFLLHAPREIVALYAVKNWLAGKELLIQSIAPSIIFSIEETELGKISALSTPNRVLAIVKQKEKTELPTPTSGLMLMLDGIQDPGNFGTIIRIADWFGITNLVCSKECADIYNPKVIQATMGSIIRTNVVYTNLCDWCKQHAGVDMYAATLQGQSIYDYPVLTDGIIVMGNESKGVSPELLGFCKKQVTIPRIGQAESLNAAVATGIILSQLIRK